MFWRKRQSTDFQAEIESHLELEIDQLRAKGLSEEDARAEARRTFGNRMHLEERFYESGRWAWLNKLSQDVRFGIRLLVKNPVPTAVAVVTLALGIGANTAIFSLINAITLRHLPVKDPKQLALFGKGRWDGSVDKLPDGSWQLFSYRGYREFQKRTAVFSEVTAIASILFSPHGRVGNSETPETIKAELVSGTYFDTLGVHPALGRLFAPTDDLTPGGHPVAVVSHSWWQRRFGSDSGVVGSKVSINSTVYTVIGVAAPDFSGMSVGQEPDLWIPLAMEKELSPAWNGLENDFFQSLYIVARLKPGVSMKEATANTNVVFQQIVNRMAGPHPSPQTLADARRAVVELTEAATGLSSLRQQFSAPLAILMAVVSLVLLIACANVANLLLARAAARRREMAVRMSIGARRSTLIRQLLVESSLLGITGAILGVSLAFGATRLLLAMASEGATERLPIDPTPDFSVLCFTLILTAATVLIFGMAPALYATRVAVGSSLGASRGNTGTQTDGKLSKTLIVSQVALSVLLLAGAGLFLRTLRNLLNVDPGFDKRNVLVTSIDPASAGYLSGPRWETTMEQIEERVSSLPGIRSATFAFFVFNGGGWTNPVKVTGRGSSSRDPDVNHNIVGAQYFDTMKMPVILGRGLLKRDDASSPRVAVINETMARVYFPGGSPIGKTFSMGDDPGFQNVQVVGMVKDGKYMELDEEQMPAAFYPHAQHGGPFLLSFAIRSDSQAAPAIPQIVKAIREIDPHLPVGDFFPLAQLVDGSLRMRRLVAQLCTLFAALAAVLACIGIYGVTSYGIVKRTNEFGIRMALGAERRDVLWMVLRDASRPAILGVGIGIVFALTAFRLLESVLYGLKFYDPLVMTVAIGAMVVMTLAASYLPARRATKIDPVTALRYE